MGSYNATTYLDGLFNAIFDIYGGSNSIYKDSRDWTQCFQATLVAVVAVVVVPVVAPVAPVAPCAGLGGFMTTDLRQLVLLMVQRSGVHQLRLVVYPIKK